MDWESPGITGITFIDSIQPESRHEHHASPLFYVMAWIHWDWGIVGLPIWICFFFHVCVRWSLASRLFSLTYTHGSAIPEPAQLHSRSLIAIRHRDRFPFFTLIIGSSVVFCISWMVWVWMDWGLFGVAGLLFLLLFHGWIMVLWMGTGMAFAWHEWLLQIVCMWMDVGWMKSVLITWNVRGDDGVEEHIHIPSAREIEILLQTTKHYVHDAFLRDNVHQLK